MRRWIIGILVVATFTGQSQAEDVVSDLAPEVWVDVDRKDHRYQDGEHIEIDIHSTVDGYLYLVHRGPSGNETLLFPNESQPDHRITAGETYCFPGAEADFRMRVRPPFGREEVLAFVTRTPLRVRDVVRSPSPQTEEEITSEESVILRQLFSGGFIRMCEILRKYPYTCFHHVYYITSDKETTQKPVGDISMSPRRFAVCVGIDQYQDETIPSINTSAGDAGAMAGFWTDQGGVLSGDCVVLTDEQATLSSLQLIFTQLLPRFTRPGDEIVLFWSGHGEKKELEDGTAVYLIPYDCDRSRVAETSLTSEILQSWLAALSDRRVLILVDASGGG
ncbi:MAG: DUF4384 domain-containing protein, partial [Planctomycetia bacterium]|nr:DUF4384 domain-containing protein [Planctomycetia bacterium]